MKALYSSYNYSCYSVIIFNLKLNSLFSFSKTAFSSLFFLLLLLISSSFYFIIYEVSCTLYFNYSSWIIKFYSLFYNSRALFFKSDSNLFIWASIFLKYFSFSFSFSFQSLSNWRRKFISFYFKLIRNLASSDFFQVSSSQIILYSREFISLNIFSLSGSTFSVLNNPYYDGNKF